MPKYACVDQANAILHQRDYPTKPPDLPHKGLRWLLVVVTEPAFDGTTQVKEGPVTTVNAADVSVVWTVRAKTAQEIDADKAAEVSGVARVLFLAAFNHENRIRVLEGQPVVTAAQFRNALKGML